MSSSCCRNVYSPAFHHRLNSSGPKPKELTAFPAITFLSAEAAISGFVDRLGNSAAVCTLDLLIWELVGKQFYPFLASLCAAILIFGGFTEHLSKEAIWFVAPLVYYLTPTPGAILFAKAIHSAVTLTGLEARRPWDQTPQVIYYALVSVPYIITGLFTATIADLFCGIIRNRLLRLAVLFVLNIGETITIISAIANYARKVELQITGIRQ